MSSRKYYATRFNNSPELVDCAASLVRKTREGINATFANLPDVAKDTLLSGILTSYTKAFDASTLDKFDAALTELNNQTVVYGEGLTVSRSSVDVSKFRSVGIDVDNQKHIVTMDKLCKVWRIDFASDETIVKTLPIADDIVSALRNVDNIDVDRLQSFADWIVKRHNIDETIPKLYIVQYTCLIGGKEQSKLTAAIADSLQSLSARLAPKCNSAGNLRTLLTSLDENLSKLDDPIVVS